MECWTDPFSMAPQKAVETIWKNLRDQYEMWQPKARSKVEVDPIVDEVKKHCNTCCRYANFIPVIFRLGIRYCKDILPVLIPVLEILAPGLSDLVAVLPQGYTIPGISRFRFFGDPGSVFLPGSVFYDPGSV
ncbi:hypothetical protein GOBAR_AA36391 [Gossypium barbadense]|uniref:Raptor N-terminal CASPase-like domain-containing protein n=1 Tax=Gossypium barbadense TaxID=3634 RepID=A0A2P5VZR1_GOSBA|nr:hypothetical protein GOBAR_AA36391 [Gossypium barbadense]